MLSDIAYGIGVPIVFIRTDSAPRSTSSYITTYFKYISSDDDAVLHRTEVELRYLSSFDKIFPGGHSFEHPFSTHLRDSTSWATWELLVYMAAVDDAKSSQTPLVPSFPVDFSEIVHVSVSWIEELGGLIVYGPIPVASGFSPTDISARIDKILPSDGAINHGRDESSHIYLFHPDRLRRMYYAGMKLDKDTFSDRVSRSNAAIKIALNARLNTNLREDSLFEYALPIIEAVSRYSQYCPEGGYWPSVSLLISDARLEISIDSNGCLAIVLTTGIGGKREIQSKLRWPLSYADNVTDMHLTRADTSIGSNRAQGMLQQFMLMRHWLNDRYARLGSLYDDIGNQSKEVDKNLRNICFWLTNLFEADFSAIYNIAPGGSLREVTRHSRMDIDIVHAANLNSNHMSELSSLDLANQRGASVSYRACRSQRTEYVRNWDGNRNSKGMSAGGILPEPRPRSSLASPIIVFGKTWGVIELIGMLPHQFDSMSDIWLEEATQLIGNALYQTWLLKQITRANLAVLSDRSASADLQDETSDTIDERNAALLRRSLLGKIERSENVLGSICKEMAELFISDAAGLWVADEQWPGRFQLRGTYGLSKNPTALGPHCGFEQPPTIAIDDTDSLVAQAMGAPTGLRRHAISEDLHRPEDVRTSREAYQRLLWEDGLRHVTIVPLIETAGGEDQRAIGALSLYARSRDAQRTELYGSRWLPLIEFAGRHLAMLIRTLALESERQTSLELMFSHEVIGSLRRVQEQYKYLEGNLLTPALGRRGVDLIKLFGEHSKEFAKASGRVKNGIGEAVQRLEEMRRDGFKMPSASNFDFRSTTPWDREPPVLYNIIQSAFNSRFSLQSRRHLSWRVTGSEDYIRINIHPNNLETIFNNLADNCLKYSSEYTDVRVHVDRRPTNDLHINFINEAPALRHGEASRLFKLGFRGERAIAERRDGSGNGLFIAKRLAQSIGVDLGYACNVHHGRSDVEHVFHVIFGGEQVIYGRQQ